MINLLPEKDKSFIKNEYRRRLIVVGATYFVALSVITIVMMLPAYLLLSVYERDLNNQLASSLEKIKDIDASPIINEIKKLNSRVEILKNKKYQKSINDILRKAVGSRPEGIRITGISYERSKKEKTDDKVSIQGTAEKRNNLLEFKAVLEKEFGENKVDSPISNLFLEKEAQFSISIFIPNE